MAERMIEANGVKLCADAAGNPGNPPVLLVMGMSASMVWWEDEFCARLAEGRHFAIRYDHRDTGRSVTYQVGHPGYTANDLVADAAGVLDAYELKASHVVGMSMGGALAQLLALDFPDRVLSLTLISTSPATPGERDLPPIQARLRRFLATMEIDWSDAASVIDYLVGYWRVLWGEQRTFDEARIRELARHDVARARHIASAQNHGVLPDEDRARGPLSSITAPTLVIHGSDDPMFPLEHAAALANEIPGAELLALQGAGHGLDPADWDTVTNAILDHTRHPDADAMTAHRSVSQSNRPPDLLDRVCPSGDPIAASSRKACGRTDSRRAHVSARYGNELLLVRDRPPERAVAVGDKAVHRDAHRVVQHGLSVAMRGSP